MRKITIETLKEIKSFRVKNGYILTQKSPLYCPQVNGLINICLSELGFSGESRENIQSFLKSSSFNTKKNLFHREVDTNGKIIVPAFNSGKNSIFALSLVETGFTKDAKKIMSLLKKSCLYNKESGLFYREYNPDTQELNTLVITQTNLWIALTYAKLKMKKEAKRIMNSLEKDKKNKDNNLFAGQDCRDKDNESRFFLDDQALAILTYIKLGEKQKAKMLMESVLNSHFYDTNSDLFNSSFSNSSVDTAKSTYKNSFLAFVLGELRYFKELKKIQKGLIKELYDSKNKLFNQTTRDSTKVPDNSALALVALEYLNIDHKVF